MLHRFNGHRAVIVAIGSSEEQLGISDAFGRHSLAWLIGSHEIFHALNINIGEIHHVAVALDMVFGIFQRPAEDAQDSQRHHGRAMHAGSAVNVEFALGLIQRFQRKFHAPLEKLWGLGLEIVIGRAEEHLYAIRFSHGTIIELDLHVDDVGYSHRDQLFHILVIPYTTSDRNAIGHPGHVHSFILDGEKVKSQLAEKQKYYFCSVLFFTLILQKVMMSLP